DCDKISQFTENISFKTERSQMGYRLIVNQFQLLFSTVKSNSADNAGLLLNVPFIAVGGTKFFLITMIQNIVADLESQTNIMGIAHQRLTLWRCGLAQNGSSFHGSHEHFAGFQSL